MWKFFYHKGNLSLLLKLSIKIMVRRMTEENTNETIKGERIAKVLARAGIASRREIERMIEDGRIALDGKVLQSPAVLVNSLDGITVDKEPIGKAEETRLWRFHKPKGMLTTHNDPQHRATVFDNLPEHLPRVISVGRLDMNTEGLLLLTNDGELARWLELPENAIVRTYRVRAHGFVREHQLKALKKGVTIEGVHYGSIDATVERADAANCWLNVSISEGKNREVRRVMEYLGLNVNRLIHTNYGPFSIGTIKRQATVEVNSKQLSDVLKDFFAQRGRSAAVEEKTKQDPSKWAKAKPRKTKPGDKKRHKPREDTEFKPKVKRPRSKHSIS